MTVCEMSWEMRERLNDTIRFHLSQVNLSEDTIPEYVDQAPTHSSWDWAGHQRYFFAAYTPHGVACIEAAFLDRMIRPAKWDSKDRIRKDILENPHMHVNIKERLLKEFEKADWARWYDSFYVIRIKDLKPEDPIDALRELIQKDTYLTERSRENLLLNLNILWSGV